jgi:hypothetical protein
MEWRSSVHRIQKKPGARKQATYLILDRRGNLLICPAVVDELMFNNRRKFHTRAQ